MPRMGPRSNTKPSSRVIKTPLRPPLPTTSSPCPSALQKSSKTSTAFSAPLPSPFLALPLEVRLNIYRHALQGRMVLFDTISGKRKQEERYQIHYYDDLYDEYAGSFKWSAGLCNFSGVPDYDTDENGRSRRCSTRGASHFKACHCQSVSTWQLLSVCRQTYFEALPIFYQLTKFSFSTPRHFWNFYIRIDKHAPFLECGDEMGSWYNTSCSLCSESPKLDWDGDGSSKPPKESQGRNTTPHTRPTEYVRAPKPKFLTLRIPELHISSLSMIRSMQILFDSNLGQANVVFRAIKEMHKLQEFCVGFRSPFDFFEYSGALKHQWVERICQVRGLRKFDLRFEDENFPYRPEKLHHSFSYLRRKFRACIQVLKQICRRSASDQDATYQNWYINRLDDVKLYDVVDEMIDQILTNSDEVNEPYCDGESDTEESDTEEADSQSVSGM